MPRRPRIACPLGWPLLDHNTGMWRPLVALIFLLFTESFGGVAHADSAADGERLRKSGRYAEAQALLEPGVERDPKGLAARRQLGLVYRATGQRDAERAIWNRFYDDYEANTLDHKSARDLTYV